MVPILHSVLVDIFAHTTFLANAVNCNKDSNNNSKNLRGELETSNRTEFASKFVLLTKPNITAKSSVSILTLTE